MILDQWTAVDQYITELLIPTDPILDAVLDASKAAGLPEISVSAAQGKLLQLYVCMLGAQKVLEIGTLGAYSTIWMARALSKGGRLITLEAEESHARVARENIASAGLADVVELRLGLALDTLPVLAAEGHHPFDFIFIDADKENAAAYFDWSLTLSRPGSVIIVDNVVRNGAIIEPENTDSKVLGIRRFNEVLAAETRVTATILQTVGSKGYDGFALAVVKG